MTGTDQQEASAAPSNEEQLTTKERILKALIALSKDAPDIEFTQDPDDGTITVWAAGDDWYQMI